MYPQHLEDATVRAVAALYLPYISLDLPRSPCISPTKVRAVAALDELAAGATPAVREEMLRAFRQSARFEWMFWDSAYRQEQWPISV